MIFDRETYKLYAVTDRAKGQKEVFLNQVEEALKGGVTCLQLREKDMDFDAFQEEALSVKALCQKYQIPFIINDNVELAIRVKADGVHVGQGDMEISMVRELVGPNMIIGVSAHNVEEAIAAEKGGADYLGAGAVFPTSTKKNVTPLSQGMLHAICHSVSIPVVAIGGINRKNLWKLAGTGVSGVALVSAIFGASDIQKECETLSTEVSKMVKTKKTVLTIAGSDSSGGAGIQADIKTMTAHGVYAMSVITALTAQNTLEVSRIMEVPPSMIECQMDAVFGDIIPDAVKIGMLPSVEIIKSVAGKLKEYQAKQVVLDPVMVSTSGHSLMQERAVETMKEELFPLVRVITPNIPEASLLSGRIIKSKEEMLLAAKDIGERWNCAVLCKGGHNIYDANDVLYESGRYHWFCQERIENPNTHGTGCTLSSAIASNLALGYDLESAIDRAKDYLTGALRAGLDLGHGSGPLDHGYVMKY